MTDNRGTPDPDLDTADEAHEVLASLPEHQRSAAAALMDLDPDTVVCNICDDETGEVLGPLSANGLLGDLRRGIASPATVWKILQQRRLILPGRTYP